MIDVSAGDVNRNGQLRIDACSASTGKLYMQIQHGAHVVLQLDINGDILLTRITRKSYQRLNLGIK